jgi:hypothetical protein
MASVATVELARFCDEGEDPECGFVGLVVGELAVGDGPPDDLWAQRVWVCPRCGTRHVEELAR